MDLPMASQEEIREKDRQLAHANRVIDLLVDRLGGEVEISDFESSCLDKRSIEMYTRPWKQTTVIRVVDPSVPKL